MTAWLIVLFSIAPFVVHATTTVTTHKDSKGYEQSTVTDGKHTQHCTTHTDSNKVTHTVCEK